MLKAVMANSCKCEPFTTKTCNRFAGFVCSTAQPQPLQQQQKQHLQHKAAIYIVIMLLAALMLPYHQTLAQETTTEMNESTTEVEMQEQEQQQQTTQYSILLVENEKFNIDTTPYNIDELPPSDNEKNNSTQPPDTLIDEIPHTPTLTSIERKDNEEHEKVNLTQPMVVEEPPQTPQLNENIIYDSIANANDIENEIFPFVEERSDIQILPEHVKFHVVHNKSQDLAESIINAVKTETEMKQFAESPSLKFLQEIPEPEMRDKLIEDLAVDPHIYEKFFPRQERRPLEVIKIDQYQPVEYIPEIIQNKYNSQVEEHFHDDQNITREIRNLNLEKDHLEDSIQKKSKEIDEVEGSGLMSPLTVNTFGYIEPNKTPGTTIHYPMLVENHEFLKDKVVTSTEEDAFSVVLDESAAAERNETETESKEQRPKEDYTESLLGIAEEKTTIIPENIEHIVIKKVLDMRDVPDNLPETTTIFSNDLSQDDHESYEAFNITGQDTLREFEENNDNGLTEEELKEANEEIVQNSEKPYDEEQDNLVRQQKAFKIDKNSEELVNKALKHKLNSEVNYTEKKFKTKEESQQDYVEKVEEQLNLLKDLDRKDFGPTTERGQELHILEEVLTKNEKLEDFKNERQYNSMYSSTTETPLQSGGSINQMEQQNDIKHGNYFATTDRATNEVLQSSSLIKGSRSIDSQVIRGQLDNTAAPNFEPFAPRNAGQTVNNHLAAVETSHALPVSNGIDNPNRSTIIIILSSSTACLFIIISVTIFLISFQRQHGTLDIEMQERSCGKDTLNEEDAETFAKLLEIELPAAIPIAAQETDECL